MKKIYIVGIGMGNPDTLTFGAYRTIKNCEAVVGARRMIESAGIINGRTHNAVAPSEILKWLREQEDVDTAAVLMSGDTGFYSGTRKLVSLLETETDWEIEVLAGISSLQYFCAKLQVPWETVKILSLHGREANFLGTVRSCETVFFLTDKQHTPSFICEALTDAGMADAEVFVGERLSYPDETITSGPAYVLAEQDFDPLSVVLVKHMGRERNPIVTHGISDDRFLRGDVPMTKEEVRSVTLSKLGIRGDDILYDIGAGTGTIAVEMALQARDGRVYAIEKNEEAAALIEENKARFGADNLHIVRGTAPVALSELPPPDRAFIGGSSGNLKEIVAALVQKNPRIRVGINVIALESLTEALAAFSEQGFEYPDIVQISSARAKAAGARHLMMAQNPVFILTAQKEEQEEDDE